MGFGLIPRHQIRDYADEIGLEPDVRAAFIYVIRQMDNAYLISESERLRAEAKK